MLKIKKSFFDRFDQTFKLIKNNFFNIFIILFWYNFIWIILFKVIFLHFFMWKLMAWDVNSFLWILTNPWVVFALMIIFLVFLVYLFFYVVIYISVLHTIKRIIAWEEIILSNILKYWMNKYMDSFKTYRFAFKYAYLLPCLILIIWLLMIMFWLSWSELLLSSWVIITIFSILFSLYFIAYRWNKSRFALFSAVEKDDFTENNFNESIKITENKWWRIFWNLLLLWFILSTLKSIISWIIWSVFFWLSGWWSLISEWISAFQKWLEPEVLTKLLEDHINNIPFIYSFLSKLLDSALNSVILVFSLVFIYLFYLRLYREFKYENPEELTIKNWNLEKKEEL